MVGFDLCYLYLVMEMNVVNQMVPGDSWYSCTDRQTVVLTLHHHSHTVRHGPALAGRAGAGEGAGVVPHQPGQDQLVTRH